MRYEPIDKEFYLRTRKNFADLMTANSICILTSNDVKHNNADDVMGFTQNNDLFYLSGIDQEESILVLYPDAAKAENREILFIKETSEMARIWDGDKLTKEQATALSGVSRIEWTPDFERILQYMAFEADGFYLGHNEHLKRVTLDQETRQDRMIKWCKTKYPLHHYERAAKLTRQLRPIKQAEEVQQMRKAINISIEGFHNILSHTKPGIKEYELEAELIYTLTKRGGNRHAFKPIIAGGGNACVLHYNTNHETPQDGDMILIDFGVCYGNYNSDTTRCIPVNGKFSDRQKEVYSSVLHCLKEGSKMLKAGVAHADYEANMASLIEAQLVKLGLLSKAEIAAQNPSQPLYKKYFMHGTAHHLGLDVHDVGLYSRDIEAGMVFTCEPGIYIREEGIGCRLENNYLITENGNVNLTEGMPIEIEEIERLMSIGNR